MPASLAPTHPVLAPLRVGFAGGAATSETDARIDTPWLAGMAEEEIFPAALPAASTPGMRLFRSGSLLIGHAQDSFVASELSVRTEALYRRILALTRGRHLYRIWNYVPQINALTAGFENYRAFCQGRSLAFQAALGSEFQPQLPAASAVGSKGRTLEVLFVAGETPPAHFENPEQVPAYLYPLEHGPRAPSFARATVARDGRRTWVFLSGTSAIKGHETVAPGDLATQTECTLDNLRLISRISGLGEDFDAGRAAQRHFKVYLRHAEDLAAARARLERSFLRPADRVTYLQADICRAALNIEIEATIEQHDA